MFVAYKMDMNRARPQPPQAHPPPDMTRRTSSFAFPTNGQLPKFSYAGVSQTQKFNVQTEYGRSNYSRFGTKDVRPKQLPINPATVFDTQYQPTQNTRRRSYGSSIAATSPLRYPPVPLSTTKHPIVTWHSGDPVVTTVGSRRGSFQSPTSTLERSWNSNLTPSALTLKHYSERLKDRERGVPMQERRVNSIVEKVFTGADALEWFLANMDEVTTVEKAQLVGQQLLKCGLITNTSDDYVTFLGSPNSLYKFTSLSTVQPAINSNTNNSETRNPQGKQENQRQRTKCILL